MRLIIGGVVVIVLLVGGSVVAMPQEGAVGDAERGARVVTGMPLADAILALRGPGLEIVFTSQIVLPTMTVVSEPSSSDPRRMLLEILEPHGLVAMQGPRDTLVVVRSVSRAAPSTGAARAEPDEEPQLVEFIEELVVTPSTVSLMRDEPTAPMSLSRDDILALPHLGDDFFRAITILPGTSSNDATAQFSVRGGRRNETQIVLDGQELYDAFHLKDYDNALSFVASSRLASAELSTGGFPAEYGDRMSGVLDMRTVVPSGRPTGRLGIAILNAQLGAQGGFNEDRGRWMVEARRGTIDLVNDLLGDEDPNFRDVYGKFDYQIDQRNNLRINALSATDELDFTETEEEFSKTINTEYDNNTAWLTHRLFLGSSLFLESAVSYTEFTQDRRGVELDEDVEFAIQDIRDSQILELRQAWNLQAAPDHFLKFGLDLRDFETQYDYESAFIFDTTLPEIGPDPDREETIFQDLVEDEYLGLYAADTWRISEPVSLEVGLRYDQHALADQSLVSPRINLAVAAGESSIVRAVWGLFNQSQRTYELMVEDGDQIFYPVEEAEHIILGYERMFDQSFANGPLAVRAEIYRRNVDNPRPRYENLYEPLNTFPEVEPDRVRIEPQESRAEGFELFVRARSGPNIRWWVNYALASTEDLIDGDWVPRSIDQTHTVNLNFDYRIGEAWTLNFAWRYHTGWPWTPLTVVEEEDDEGEVELIPVLGKPNSNRFPIYHRLDVRASRRWQVGRRGSLTVFVDIQNLYDRNNRAGFDVSIDDEEGGAVFEPEDWVGILPSAGIIWEF